MTLKSAPACVKPTSHSSTARPQEKAQSAPLAPQWRERRSMPAIGFLHRGELLRTGRTLIRRLPGFVGHAVDGLAALVLADRGTLGVRRFLEPVGQAVAAEAREIHQVDILNIGAGAQ